MAQSNAMKQSSAPPAPRVSICIATYKRPRLLGELLSALNGLSLDDDQFSDLRLIVVDNDAAQSARAALSAWSDRWPLDYVVEPSRGVATARNAAIAAGLDRSDYLAFIDDDEVPDPNWLASLLAVALEEEASLVFGPVDRLLPNQTQDRIERPTAGNLLISSKIFNHSGLRFDPAFDRSGGEDLMFFQTAKAAGFSATMAQDARVREHVPASRIDLSARLLGRFQDGNIRALIDTMDGAKVTTRLARFGSGVSRLGWGLLRLPTFPFVGGPQRVEVLGDVLWGAGAMAGLAGVVYNAHNRVHLAETAGAASAPQSSTTQP